MLSGLFIVGNSSNAFSQAIKLGEQVPEFESDQVYNYISDTIKLSDIKKKWILIDFWATSCASCIANFGKTDALQKKFSNELQIVLVNKQSLDSTKRFFIAKKKVQKPDIPMITSDTQLNAMFPNYAYPYYVLLDKDRIVRAFPEHEYIAEKTFQDLFENDRLNFGLTNPKRFDTERPLFENLDSAHDKRLISYFMVSNELGTGTGGSVQKVGGSQVKNRIVMTNMSLNEIIRYAYNHEGKAFYAQNAVVVRSADAINFRKPSDVFEYNKWRTKYLYCLDLLVKPDKANRLFDELKSKIQEYFEVKISEEKASIPCYVLKKIQHARSIATKGGLPLFEQKNGEGEMILTWRNQPFSDFANTLGLFFQSRKIDKPFVDASGITGNVDILFRTSVFEKFERGKITDLNISLAELGLVIVEENHLVDILHVEEKK